MAKVTIQYWAAAREAAGMAAETVDAQTLAEALELIVARRGDDERLRSVLSASSTARRRATGWPLTWSWRTRP